MKERKLALITGGTSGIGYATAKRLAADYDLALVFLRNSERARAAQAELRKIHPSSSIFLFQKELLGHESCKELYSAVLTETGREPEVLVHSAGRGRKNLYAASEFSETEAMIGEHLLSAMSLSHLLLPSMYKAGRGKIILIGSMAARNPIPGQASYAAAKAGLEGFAKALSTEVFRRGITINCVAAGLIHTPLTDSIVASLRARKEENGPPIGLPEDVANVVAFLCSKDALHISGSTLTVNAGP